jgi:hypothetical protein
MNMPEMLAPTVFTRLGDTTHEDTVTQAHRVEASVWQALVNERQQRLQVRTAYIMISYVGLTHPEKDHTDTFLAFRNAWAHGRLASNRVRFVELTAEPAETSEDIEAVGESFRKLRENFSEAWKGVFVAFTRATSETSTLVSWRPAVHRGTTSRAPLELEWTEKKNQRRCDLVDKEIDGTISVAEKVELDQLQAEMLAYRRQVAPLPLEELRKLHQELLHQASDQTAN